MPRLPKLLHFGIPAFVVWWLAFEYLRPPLTWPSIPRVAWAAVLTLLGFVSVGAIVLGGVEGLIQLANWRDARRDRARRSGRPFRGE